MSIPEPSQSDRYVSRGGLKLAHALSVFQLDVANLRCADFGANVGGFTDCLLKHGAAHVTAIDTGYGTLAWTLRNDPRVTVRERTNALHAPPPAPDQRVDLVVIDMAWTPQRLCIPAAMNWLSPEGRIITLIKPHYELREDEKHLLNKGVLDPADAEPIVQRVADTMPSLNAQLLGLTQSPVEGGQGKKNTHGNREWLALLAPVPRPLSQL